MTVSTRLSDAIHILAYLKVYQQSKLSSQNIAKSVMTSPVVVRRIMSTLTKARLIKTVHGSPNPRLARPASEINLLEIYDAVEGDKSLFAVDKRTNMDCIVGSQIQKVLNKDYHEAQNAAFSRLRRITLQDVIDDIIVNYQQGRDDQR